MVQIGSDIKLASHCIVPGSSFDGIVTGTRN